MVCGQILIWLCFGLKLKKCLSREAVVMSKSKLYSNLVIACDLPCILNNRRFRLYLLSWGLLVWAFYSVPKDDGFRMALIFFVPIFGYTLGNLIGTHVSNFINGMTSDGFFWIIHSQAPPWIFFGNKNAMFSSLGTRCILSGCTAIQDQFLLQKRLVN
jgi:hypothetical protein